MNDTSAPDQKGWEKPMEKGEISITYGVNKLLGSWDVHQRKNTLEDGAEKLNADNEWEKLVA